MPTVVALCTPGAYDAALVPGRLGDVVRAASAVAGLASVAVGEAGATQPQLLASDAGAVLALTADAEEATGLLGRATRYLADNVPGGDRAVARVDYEPGQLATALGELVDRLTSDVGAGWPSVPLGALAVTASCAVSGQPAVALGGADGRRPRSRLLAPARSTDSIDTPWQRLLDELSAGQRGRLVFADDVNDLAAGPLERRSLGLVDVAVEGFAAGFVAWQRGAVEQGATDDEVAASLRTWSSGLSAAASGACAAVLAATAGAVVSGPTGPARVAGAIPALDVLLVGHRQPAELVLPVRPILVGAGRLVFVCDGRLALDLAAVAARALAAARPAHGERPLPEIGAGVAVVACETSLVDAWRTARQRRRAAQAASRASAWQGGGIDWQVGSVPARSGPDETFRPYPLRAGDRPLSWPWLRRELLGAVPPTSLRGPRWQALRHRVDALASAARQGGPTAVADSLASWRLAPSPLCLPPAIQPDGFPGGRTPLLDAWELLDCCQLLATAEEAVL